MNITVVLVIVAVVAALIFFSPKPSPEAQRCANELAQMFKKKRDLTAKEIAEHFKAHGRTFSDVGEVTKLMKTALTKAGIRKEEYEEMLVNIRSAKKYLADQ